MHDLSKLGFVDGATVARQRRLIVSVTGREKMGKSNFGLTAPGPMALFDLDHNLEGLMEKFTPLKKIHYIDIADTSTVDEAVREWDKFKRAWVGVLNDKSVRSVVIDTATEAWERIRLARFGKLSQVMPMHYGPVNAEFRKLLRDARDAGGKNVVLLHKAKAVYVNDKRTGDYERAGYGETGFLVQVNVRVYRDPYDVDTGPGDFHMVVENCTQNPEIQGMDLVGPMVNFSTLAQLVFPDSNAEEWE